MPDLEERQQKYFERLRELAAKGVSLRTARRKLWHLRVRALGGKMPPCIPTIREFTRRENQLFKNRATDEDG